MPAKVYPKLKNSADEHFLAALDFLLTKHGIREELVSLVPHCFCCCPKVTETTLTPEEKRKIVAMDHIYSKTKLDCAPENVSTKPEPEISPLHDVPDRHE